MNEHDPIESGSTAHSGWVRFLKISAIVGIVVVALINVFAGLIPPLVVFAVVWLIGVLWLRRSTKGPAILLLVAFIAFMVLSAPFVIPTLTVPASAGDFVLNLASLLAAIAGVVGAINVLRRRLGPTAAPRTLGRALVGIFVLATAFSVFSTVTYDDAEAREGDIELVTKELEFDNTSLEAESGEVSVYVDNLDATLHTFTIEELDVHLDIPASRSARVTFDAPPGTYKFICVPHKEDMEGTLTIK